MTRTFVLLVWALGFLASCSTPDSGTAARPRFAEEENTDLVIRYYSDQTSYVLKPRQMDGAFMRIFAPDAVVELARQQPRRDLAAVVMVFYTEDKKRATVEEQWTQRLRSAGFRRVVFLLATNEMKVNGLEIIADSAEAGQVQPPAKPPLGGAGAR